MSPEPDLIAEARTVLREAFRGRPDLLAAILSAQDHRLDTSIGAVKLRLGAKPLPHRTTPETEAPAVLRSWAGWDRWLQVTERTGKRIALQAGLAFRRNILLVAEDGSARYQTETACGCRLSWLKVDEIEAERTRPNAHRRGPAAAKP